MTKNILFISIDPIIYRRRVLNQIETAVQIGWIPTVISTGADLNFKVDYQIHLIKQPFKRGPIRFLHFNYKALRIILKSKVDVIHARGLWVLPAIIIAGITRKFRLIYDAHEFFAGHELFQKHLWRRLTWLKLEKHAIPKMDALLTVSEPLGNFYNELYPALKHVEIIRSLPKLDEAILSKLKEENEILTLSFHGYFLPGRGLTQLIDALAVLKDHAFHLKLIGEGPLKSKLENKINSLDLSRNVEFHPFVESDKLLEKIRSADLGIVLIEADSINRANALPNKFFEYIHAGVPVLASNITTLKAYVKEYNVGFIVDPYNQQEMIKALKQVFENRHQLNEYRTNCIKAAKELCWQNESKKLQMIYTQL